MVRWWIKIALFAFVSLSLAACQRPISESAKTRVVIQAPIASNKLQKSGGVGGLSTLPANRKACYAVSVSGPGISGGPGQACSFASGVFAGFVEPGQTISLQVPQGTDRKVELFAYLEAEGQNLPCPGFAGALTPAQTAQTYLVGSVTGLSLQADSVTVEIVTSFPGLANNIGASRALPATCFASGGGGSSSPHIGFHVSSGAGVATSATGAGIRLVGRLSATPKTTLLQGTGINLIVK